MGAGAGAKDRYLENKCGLNCLQCFGAIGDGIKLVGAAIFGGLEGGGQLAGRGRGRGGPASEPAAQEATHGRTAHRWKPCGRTNDHTGPYKGPVPISFHGEQKAGAWKPFRSNCSPGGLVTAGRLERTKRDQPESMERTSENERANDTTEM